MPALAPRRSWFSWGPHGFAVNDMPASLDPPRNDNSFLIRASERRRGAHGWTRSAVQLGSGY
jgi:hypothetical protein